jgi:hypothetical protein
LQGSCSSASSGDIALHLLLLLLLAVLQHCALAALLLLPLG